jgi:hypothetical protein
MGFNKQDANRLAVRRGSQRSRDFRSRGRRLLGKKLLLAICVVAGALFAAAPASASPSYHYDPTLRVWVHNVLAKASTYEVVPKPVEVRCYNNRQAFELSGWVRGFDPTSVIAYYMPGSNSIYMRASSCAAAHQFIAGMYTSTTVGAFTTLLHEALHRQGFHNERTTEAYAIASMLTAGQLVQYKINIARGAPEGDSAWEAAGPKGEQAQQIAFNQSNRIVASNYRTTWAQITNATADGWDARLGL